MQSPDMVVSGGDCPDATSEGALVSASPFTRVRYRFGMLLGVDDFETEQAYHRAKGLLERAWLHTDGVVWGLGVFFNESRKLQVDPGLALDASGRELHLDAAVCLDIGSWYEAHKDDADLHAVDEEGGGKRFDAHVVIRYRACLSRSVPALADPCGGALGDTAHSRVVEVAEILLRPGLSQPRAVPYRRLRVLFSLEDPTGNEDVVARRDEILRLPHYEQPRAYLEAFREFAVLDELDLRPPADQAGNLTSIFPERDPLEVVLADVGGIVVKPAVEGFVLADPLPPVDLYVRPTLVATATIQELLCGPLFWAGTPDYAVGGDAGGPRIYRDSVELDGTVITFTVSARLRVATITPDAFCVTVLHRDRWRRVEIRDLNYDREANAVGLRLAERPVGEVVRLIVWGTGEVPLLGADLVPFAGASDGPPGTIHNGNDFVHMIARS